MNSFQIPPGMLGRFAVVKLWPEIKTAEDECIARLKLAASELGLECVEVHADGTLLAAPDTKVSRATVDFVLHLHYDTPKRYDAFSIVALWNPIRFYHEWGYERTSRNLTTHDDFISCLSTAADDHVTRMIRRTRTHLPPCFRLFHSTPDVIHPPSLGDHKLFYAGINWEAISGGKSRHQEVLKRLDDSGLLRIYGPTLFQGVRVWAGYRSYVKEVPFDGISMIDEISRAGVALVLSSQAHRESELMSNRLFESIAAGALVICDENPFAARHFGDALLYIDSRWPVERIERTIREHLAWAREQPDAALEKIAAAQGIFREKFTLLGNVRDLYTGLPGRMAALKHQQNPPGSPRMHVRLDMLLPELTQQGLQAHIASAKAQTYPDVSCRIVLDTGLDHEALQEATNALEGTGITMVQADYAWAAPHSDIRTRRPVGAVLLDLLSDARQADGVIFVAPNERLFSNHVAVLAGALQRDPSVTCAATAALLDDGQEPVHAVHELIDLGWSNPRNPAGFGRFITRTSSLPDDLGCALRYLDTRAMAVLIGNGVLAQELPASITIDLQSQFPVAEEQDPAVQTEIIRDFSPEALVLRFGHGPAPQMPAPGQVGSIDSTSWTALRLVRMLTNVGWVKLQWRILRKQGARARLEVLRRKLGLA